MSRRDGLLTIGMLWHAVNSGNLGVGALTVSNLVLARQAAAAAGLTARFKIIGFLDPGSPIYVEGPDIEIVPLNGRALLPGGSYGQALADVDCLLDIGSGDSFTDIYGVKRFAYLWLTKQVAFSKRKPLVFSPQTIGPFSKQPQTSLAASALRQARLVVARDPLSFVVAQRLAPDQTVLQAVDVAFALPYEPRPRGTGAPLQVGLNVSGLLFSGGYTGRNEFGLDVDYAAYTRGLIERLLQRGDSQVWLVTHANTEAMARDDDSRVAEQLKAEYPQVEIAPYFASPSDAKSYISGLDFLVAGRMHACIAAFSSGVPVVPVAYSRKFAGLFEGVLNYSHLVPVNGLSTEAAIAFTLHQLDNRAALKADIDRGMGAVEGLLDGYKQALTEVFAGLA